MSADAPEPSPHVDEWVVQGAVRAWRTEHYPVRTLREHLLENGVEIDEWLVAELQERNNIDEEQIDQTFPVEMATGWGGPRADDADEGTEGDE